MVHRRVSFLQHHRHVSCGRHRLALCMKRRPQRQHQALSIFPLPFLTSFAAMGSINHDLRRGRKVTSRITFDVYKHVATIGNELFRRLYRISFPQFETLVRLTKPYLQSLMHRSSIYTAIVSTEVQICVTLRILADASYLDVDWPYGIGRSTTYAVFSKLYRL